MAQSKERCPHCQGTGRVIEFFGEEPQIVICHYCDGSGRAKGA